jgi:hypothetical protein
MPTELWAALIAVGGTLTGLLITLIFEDRRRQVDHKRWYGEFFVSPQLNAIRDLGAAMVDCYQNLTIYPNVRLDSQEFRESVINNYVGFQRAFSLASMYLDLETQRTIDRLTGTFSDLLTRAIYVQQGKTPHSDYHTPEYLKISNNLRQDTAIALEALKPYLNPELLSSIKPK